MLTKTCGAAVCGIDAIRVNVEVSVDHGMGFFIVGLPDTAVKESIQRVTTALKQWRISVPAEHSVVVNMSPASVKKIGSSYDLTIAVGLASALGVVPSENLSRFMVMGELALDGSILPIPGALPIAIEARRLGLDGLIVPQENATEAAVVNNLNVYGMKNLGEVMAFFKGERVPEPVFVDTRREFEASQEFCDFDFSEVKGQQNVKRAFEVACAGGHNILLIGSPGSGKSMMAKRLPSILPPLTLAEALETTKIHSVAGKLPAGSRLLTRRPFRSPHHTISPVALVGGGHSHPAPGEISLAHNGVLFMDEFPEFPRSVLEVMRQPLEDRTISISRASYSVEYPAGFMLVASMNPCPCGYYTHPTKECTCQPGAISRYLGKISGPLLDRIDIQIPVTPVKFEDLSSQECGESSAAIRARVIAARELQRERFRDEPGIHCNAQMNQRLLERYARPDADAMELLGRVIEKFQMSARAYDRIRKVARTIADLEASPEIRKHHIHEAVSYRDLDRSGWGKNF